jgi:hypothetical protein
MNDLDSLSSLGRRMLKGYQSDSGRSTGGPMNPIRIGISLGRRGGEAEPRFKMQRAKVRF